LVEPFNQRRQHTQLAHAIDEAHSASAGRSPRCSRGPWGAARLGRSARRGAGRDAGDVRDSAGMHCPRTPAETREPGAQGCAKGADEGCPSLWLLSLGHARESDSGRPKDGPKALAPAFRSERRTLNGSRHKSRAATPEKARSERSARPSPQPLSRRERGSERRSLGTRRAWSPRWARAHPMKAPRPGSPKG